MALVLDDDIQYLKGVGPAAAKKLNRIGVYSVRDLLYCFPRAYDDRREVKLLRDVREGDKATFRFKVIQHSRFMYNGKLHPKITVADESEKAFLYCFNRDFITNALKTGVVFHLTGAYTRKRGVKSFSQFEYDLDNKAPLLKILPVYRLTTGLSQKFLRKLADYAVSSYCGALEEDIPAIIRDGYKLGTKGDIIKEIHYPADMDSLRRAKEALSYAEFFKYQLVVALARNKNVKIKKNRIECPGRLKEDFLKKLDFSLTDAQKRVLEEIESDLNEPRPMNRMIQGDVGSGKTVVALLSGLLAVERGGQIAIMAPTEILARQHFYTTSKYLQDLPVNVGYISGSVKGMQRKEIVLGMLKKEINVVIGTHALFSEDIHFGDLSLVIIDEQHKFGVLQRGSLRAKGEHPDCIVMSATPIPRTLSMILYGDLDISVIDEMPAGRAGVETRIVKQAEIEKVYVKVVEEVKKGRQAYFIYPVIEESKNADLKNAIDSYNRLKGEVFKDMKVGLLHGRLSDDKKEKIMGMFKDRRYDVLVATTVVEVGVDVPNATVMVIEQAERFGLSNMHQLRGRIGRGSDKSYCYLVPDRSTPREAFNRLRILQDTSDGFRIAEYDLKRRGPGDIIGRRQSGIPSFIIDDFDVNTRLIYRAQKDARRFVKGEIGPDDEREKFLKAFISSDSYREAMQYFGG
jgi:ATP-dependent DNA helicase RecG